ncbi:recombinase RecT [uncultured Ruminococcus sp.]|uniref:recombinase RecT n=1 Tax=uncultured Ruminococcus sp. TaxID=165186 RepID=UPI0025DE84B5|nr:recombinase RecT [uncultured Ruminococcus sp.]
MNNTQLTPVDNFKQVLNSNDIKARLKNSLKNNWTQFSTSMLDLYSGDSYLQKCDPYAVAVECVKAATLDLPISKSLGFAYVVPYKSVPTFIIGYKGLIQLAQRTGQYKTINADIVYEGELAGYDKLSGMIDISGEKILDDEGEPVPVGYFAYFKLVSGFEKMLYMSKEEVEEWRDKYSPSGKSGYSPWKTEFDKMALKTCLRRLLSTYGIMSTEMTSALAQDSFEINAQKRAEEKVQSNANSTVIDLDRNTGEVVEKPTETVRTGPDF